MKRSSLAKTNSSAKSVISGLVLKSSLLFIASIFSMIIIESSFSNNASAATYSLSLETNPININVSPGGNGATVEENDVKVISTCPSGYTLNIQGPEDTTLYKDGDSSNSSSNNSNNYINASTGTKTTPVSILGNNMNTWGYSIDSNTTINSNFIGLTNNIVELMSTNTATPDTGSIIPIYYGVSVTMNRTMGTYTMANSGAITYQLVTSLDCTSYQVQFNANGGTGTMDNQRISEDTATALVSNAFTGPSATPYFTGWNTAADGSGTSYAKNAEVTNIASVGNTITLYAQWTDCPPNNVCYDDNGANSPTKMGNESFYSSDKNVLLWASNYKYDTDNDGYNDYGFIGWSTNPKAMIGTDKIYGPMETMDITAEQYADAGLKLYAVWQEAATDNNDNPIYLQDWNSCSSLSKTTYNSETGEMTVASNSIITLKDKRDNQAYAVARLADGNCWMIENLRLEAENTRGNNINDPTITNESLAQGYGKYSGTGTNYGDFIGLADAETNANNFKNTTTANSLYYSGTQSGTATMNIGVDDKPEYRMPRYNNTNTNLVNDYTTTNTSSKTYSYGNYYTWAAAIANTNLLNISSDSIAADTSICPKGWKLPRADASSSGSFSYLNRQIGNYTNRAASEKWKSFPNNFIYSNGIGSIINGGRYWSVSGQNNSMALTLYVADTLLYVNGMWDKATGLTVRCIKN